MDILFNIFPPLFIWAIAAQLRYMSLYLCSGQSSFLNPSNLAGLEFGLFILFLSLLQNLLLPFSRPRQNGLPHVITIFLTFYLSIHLGLFRVFLCIHEGSPYEILLWAGKPCPQNKKSIPPVSAP